MKFFVESVTTYTSTGKSRKGAILQKVAKQFEHTVIGDNYAMTALITVFERLVDACNKTYTGRRLVISYNKFSHHISVKPECQKSFDDSAVFSMQLAPIGLTLFSSNIHQMMHSDLTDNNEPKLLEAYRSKQLNDYLEKGGEK